MRSAITTLPAAAALVLLAAVPAGAHPLAVSQDLRAGAPATITLFLFPDEGAVSGFDVTLPGSFRLVAARGDTHLTEVVTTGQLVRFRTAPGAPPLAVPDQSIVTLSGTSSAGALDLSVVAQRVGQAPFDYGVLAVSAPATARSEPSTVPRVLLTAGLLVAGAAVALVAALRRRSRGRLGA